MGAADNLDGGAGNDTLFAQISTSVTPNIRNIENVTLTSTAAVTADMTNNAALKNFTSQGATGGALTLQGVSKAAAITIADTSQNHTITYNDVTGTADSASITLRNFTGANTLDVAGVETLNIASTSAANTIGTLTAAETTKLVVSGDKALTITNNAASVNNIDASTATGALTATMTPGAATVVGGSGNDAITFAGTGAVSVNGGAGNDTFTFGTTFGSTDTVDGGDGTDTLDTDVDNVDNAAITSALTRVTNVETLALRGFADGNTVNVTDIASSINRVNLVTASGAFDNTLNMGSGAQTVGIRVAAAVAAGQTLTVDAAGVGTSDSLTITNGLTTGDMGSTTSNITTTDFETVAINTGSYATAATQNLGVVNVGSGNAATVSGSNSLTLAANFVGRSLNASGLTGDAVLTMGAAATVTSITGSSNSDTLVGDASSSIDGGAGNDTITGGTGNDTLLGGDGNDTITSSGGAGDSVDGGNGNDTVVATLTAGNTIVGGAGTDILSLATAATAATASGVSGFETLRLTGAGLTQDMVLFLDNNTFTTLQNAGVTSTFNNVGAGVTNYANTATGSTVTISRLVDTAANALTVTGLTGTTLTAVTANNEETINLASSSSGAIEVTTLTAQDLQTLNITGSGAVTVTTLAANSSSTGSVLTINGSTNTGGINVSAVNSTLNANVTGSAVASSTITGGAGADTITGGGAADIIAGGVGADTLVGGAGADTFQVTSTVASFTGGTPGTAGLFETISDYEKGIDIIDDTTAALTLSADATTTAAAGVAGITLATGIASFHVSDSTLALRVAAVNASLEAGTEATGQIAIFEFSGDTYVYIYDNTADTVAALDGLIKLTGVTGITASDLTTSAGNLILS